MHTHAHTRTHTVTESFKLILNSTLLFSARDRPCGRRVEGGTQAQTNATSEKKRISQHTCRALTVNRFFFFFVSACTHKSVLLDTFLACGVILLKSPSKSSLKNALKREKVCQYHNNNNNNSLTCSSFLFYCFLILSYSFFLYPVLASQCPFNHAQFQGRFVLFSRSFS